MMQNVWDYNEDFTLHWSFRIIDGGGREGSQRKNNNILNIVSIEAIFAI
jgi:hypothetical protein